MASGLGEWLRATATSPSSVQPTTAMSDVEHSITPVRGVPAAAGARQGVTPEVGEPGQAVGDSAAVAAASSSAAAAGAVSR